MKCIKCGTNLQPEDALCMLYPTVYQHVLCLGEQRVIIYINGRLYR